MILTSTTMAPGFTMSLSQSVASLIAADTYHAPPQKDPEVENDKSSPWHDDVKSNMATGFLSILLRPITTARLPAIGSPVEVNHVHDTFSVHGTKLVSLHQMTDVNRMKSICIFIGETACKIIFGIDEKEGR